MNTLERSKIILVRHGQTEWNDGSRFQGHLDSPLTRVGVLQAQSLGTRLLNENIAALYSSDLGRAVQTAQFIAEVTKLEPVTDPRLRERALGIFQGLSRDEIAARFPEETRRYFSRDPHYAVPGGQSVVQHFEIGFSCLDEIAQRHVGSTVVVVTHGGLVQGMFRHVTGLPFDSPRRFAIRNAAYNAFLRNSRGWSLETWGDVAHYPAEILDSAGFHVESYTPEVTA